MNHLLRLAVSLLIATGLGACSALATRHSNGPISACMVSADLSKLKSKEQLFKSYPIVAGPRMVKSPDSARLHELLAKVYTIDWPGYRCAFHPQYGVTARYGVSRTDALICPGCGETRFYSGVGDVRRAFLGPHANEALSILRDTFSDVPQQ